MSAFHTACTRCGSGALITFSPTCPRCGAMTDVSYDLESVVLRDSENPYERFFDLIPVADESLLPEDAAFTPAIHAERLGAEIGLQYLYLKDETGLPTGTTKDRMAAIALPYLHEARVRDFATSSTGNSSSAYSHALARVPEMVMYIFTAERFRERLTLRNDERIVDIVLRDATFVDAFEAAGNFAAARGCTSERGFFNPGRREGLKLAWLEAAEQVPRQIDWYVQAISSAMGVYGVYKGALELHQLGLAGAPPQLLCVQEDTCAPMVAAWRDGSETIRPEHIVHDPQGIAQAIQRGDPTRAYPYIRRIVRQSGGSMTAVSEREIRDACSMVLELEGVSVCFAAAAAVAGMLRHHRETGFSSDDAVLVNLTGGNRSGTPPNAATHVVDRAADGWDFSSLDAARTTR